MEIKYLISGICIFLMSLFLLVLTLVLQTPFWRITILIFGGVLLVVGARLTIYGLLK